MDQFQCYIFHWNEYHWKTICQSSSVDFTISHNPLRKTAWGKKGSVYHWILFHPMYDFFKSQSDGFEPTNGTNNQKLINCHRVKSLKFRKYDTTWHF